MDRAVVSPPKSSWLVKFIESFIVVGLVYSAYVLSLLLPKGWKIPLGAFSIGFFAAFIFAICFSIVAHCASQHGMSLFQDVYWNNTLTGKLAGLELTWTYFGFSNGLSAIIAFAQIGGSILLLFRKTTLLGVCILLPVLLNITLIDIFYGIFAVA